MYMFNLPKQIIIKIFEFDPTYKIIYNSVINDFKLSTPYWEMYSDLMIEQQFHVFRMTYKQALDKSNYWNQRYNYISLRKNLTPEERNKLKNNPVIYNYPRYTSDVFPNQPYFRERFYHRKKYFNT